MKTSPQKHNTSHVSRSIEGHLSILPRACTLLGIIVMLSSCGDNIAEKYAPANDYEKAELEMERSQFSQASERLEVIISANPSHHKARSLLAASYAAQAGVTTLGLIKGAAVASGAEGTPIEQFNQILPDATISNLALMEEACTLMELIPNTELNTEMSLQRSLFLSAYAFLQIKFFTTNTEALANISISDAAKLILTLAKATGASGNSTLSTLASSVSNSLEQIPGDEITKVKTTLGVITP